MLGVSPTMDTIVLSADGQFKIDPKQLRGTFPDDAQAYLVIKDDAGALLAQFDGEVTSGGISFMESPDAVSVIPHGAQFQLFVEYHDDFGPTCIRYGTVVRREPTFPLALTVAPDSEATQYTAHFQGNLVSPLWVPLAGGLQVHQKIFQTTEYSLGPNFTLFSKACARWLYSMNMDSVSVNIRVVNGGTGTFKVLVCGDYQMQTYIGIRFHSDSLWGPNNIVTAITGTGPTTSVDRGDSVQHTVATGDTYTIKYDFLANTISLYSGNSSTPLVQWEDADQVVPHGPGFRYTALAWDTSLLSVGLEPTAWEIRDGV